MKSKLLILGLILNLYVASWAQVRKTPAETTIQQVTVFSSGAQVQRTVSVAIQAGRTEIQFSGLSNQLDQQSVQLKADAAITLLSVQAAKDFFGERKIEQEERSLLDRQTTLKDKIDVDNKLLEVYRQEESMLIKNQSIGGTAGVKATDLQAALDLQRQRLTDLYQKQLETAKRVQNSQQEWERTRQQLGEIGKKKDSVNYTVLVLVDSKETRNVRFTLSYTVKDAGWYPSYDVRVSDLGKPVDLLMSANVFQRSGETWKDVALLLSTGNPTDNATPSQLQPWMLAFYDPNTARMQNRAGQPGVVMGRVANERDEPVSYATVYVRSGNGTGTTADANGFFRLQSLPANAVLQISAVGYEAKSVAVKPGYYSIKLKQAEQQLSEAVVVSGYGTPLQSDLEGKAAGMQIRGLNKSKEEEMQSVVVTTNHKPTTTVYEIDDKYTLETDGKTTTINIKRQEVPALFEYNAIPKLDPAAFLGAKLSNWQELDLQSGEANLFFEGTYLGKTYLDLGAVGDTLNLSLGKDNGVRIQRKLVKEFTVRRFIGANRTETRQYEILVRNTKRSPVNIVVQDQFPVSTNKDIEVDERRAPDAQIDKETGFATWVLTLQPGEERKLVIGYSVKYPKDQRVVLE